MNSYLIVLACLLAISQASPFESRLFGRSFEGRIIGGRDAIPGEFPHQVSLQIGIPPKVPFQHFCGGTILNERWILTAAHCVQAVDDYKEQLPVPIIFVVKAGKHNLNKVEDTEQTSVVASYYAHKKYAGQSSAGPFDIALVKLKAPLRLNKRVVALPLPKEDSEISGEATLSGWGSVNADFEHPKMPTILQTVNITIVDHKTCDKAVRDLGIAQGEFLPEGIVDETNICTMSLRPGVSACSGDSGGPLIAEDSEGQKTIVGVVSWGIVPCGTEGAPSVYASVQYFRNWVNEMMGSN